MFKDKLYHSSQTKKTNLILQIAPKVDKLPVEIQRYDDPFLPYSKALIDCSIDLVCAYYLDFAAFMALGAAGAIALERTCAYVEGSVPNILHASLGSIDYSDMLSENTLAVDAVTVKDLQIAQHYITHPPYGAILSEGVSAQPEIGWLSPDHRLSFNDPSISYSLLRSDFMYQNLGLDYQQRLRDHLEALKHAD
ncbi:hypothetical protein MASR2M15_02620 [Anaerolineales bacterium]